MKRFLPIAILLSLFLSTIPFSPNAFAVYGGVEVVGSEQVVVILDNKDSRNGGCTGALLTSRIVLTAAHCVGKPGKYPGVLRREHWSSWISQPGVDFKKDDIATRIQSAYVVITDSYTNSYDPNNNDYLTTVDDIAFIFLKKPIEIGSYPKIANETEVKRLKQERALISHFGYGLSDKDFLSGKPKKVSLRIRPRERSYEITNIVPENFSIITDETGDSALCGGDSGGPWYANLDGKILIVANTVGASGCKGSGSGKGGTFGTLVHQYEALLWKKWEYFLSNENEILKWETNAFIVKESRVQALKNSGQYYQEQSGCHGNSIIAQLQSNKLGTWKDVANVEGWISLNSSCYQPWTGYRAEKGELLRWRLASQGAWEVFTSPITETTSTREAENLAAELKTKQEAEAKAAAELKAKQEAEAKAAAELKAMQEAEVKAATEAAATANKIKTINCIKGKLTKKVTSTKPVCPSGYKKKYR